MGKNLLGVKAILARNGEENGGEQKKGHQKNREEIHEFGHAKIKSSPKEEILKSSPPISKKITKIC